jgi:hypothetical protein
VTFFNRPFVKRNGQPRIGDASPNEKPVLNYVFLRRPDDWHFHNPQAVFHKSTPSTEKFLQSQPADSINKVGGVLPLT